MPMESKQKEMKKSIKITISLRIVGILVLSLLLGSAIVPVLLLGIEPHVQIPQVKASPAEGDYTDEHWDTSVQSDSPESITTDGSNIWIVDPADTQVYKYTMAGVYVDSWDTSSESSTPYGITTDGSNIWILDYDTDEVYKYSMAGVYADEHWDTGVQTWWVYDIATDGSNIWVGDQMNDEVYKYTMAGVYVSKWGSWGEGPTPQGIATDGSYIWLVDYDDDEVYKYSMAGVYTETHWDTSGQSEQPYGITTDGINIWVLDVVDKEVYKYEYQPPVGVTETWTFCSTTTIGTTVCIWTVIQVVIDPTTTVTVTSSALTTLVCTTSTLPTTSVSISETTTTTYTTSESTSETCTTTCDTSIKSSTSSTTTCDTMIHSSTSSTTTCETICETTTITHTTSTETICETLTETECETTCETSTITHTTECETICETSTETEIETECETTCETSTITHTTECETICETLTETFGVTTTVTRATVVIDGCVLDEFDDDALVAWYNNTHRHDSIVDVVHDPAMDDPDTISVVVGTLDDGNIASVQTFDDGDTYNVSEVVGSPGYDIRFNFTGLTDTYTNVNCSFYLWYDGGAGHDVYMQTWNYTSGAWIDCGLITEGADFGWFNFSRLGAGPDIVSDGIIIGRINHTDSGNINHDIYIDYIELRLDVCPCGQVWSENMLEDLNVTQIVQFRYNITIPTAGDAFGKMQFSQDNSTWVGSGGIEAWEDMVDGDNTILLTGLGWEGNFYYRIWMHKDINGTSPTLDLVQVCYSTIPPGGGPGILVLVALVAVAAVLSIAGLKKRW